MPQLDPSESNRRAWDKIAAAENKWFRAVSTDEIDRARTGDWNLKLTPTRNIPKNWFGDIAGSKILCLAAGGGQQAPLLAAAGAQVTVVDNSPGQLARDRQIATKHDLNIETLVADMRDINPLPSNEFDLIVNPTSVCYIDDVQPVWEECHRLLAPGGSLIAGMINPAHYLFEPLKRDRNQLEVAHPIPYSDLDLSSEVQSRILSPERPIEFGHSLSALIGGQLKAGLVVIKLLTDRWGDSDALSDLVDLFIATKSTKLET